MEGLDNFTEHPMEWIQMVDEQNNEQNNDQ